VVILSYVTEYECARQVDSTDFNLRIRSRYYFGLQERSIDRSQTLYCSMTNNLGSAAVNLPRHPLYRNRYLNRCWHI
jgi:hypothetical protein